MVPPFGDKHPVFAVVVSPHRERDLRVGKLRSKHLTHTSKKGARETDVQSDLSRDVVTQNVYYLLSFSLLGWP